MNGPLAPRRLKRTISAIQMRASTCPPNSMSAARTLTLVRTTVLSVALLLAAFGRSMAQTPSAKKPPSCKSGPEWSDGVRLRCLASRTPSSRSASCIARAPKGWKTYVNRVHGFCISYPPIYKQRTPPFLFTDSSRYAAYLRKAEDDGRVLVLERIGDEDVTILVRLDEKLDRSAPIQAFGLFDLTASSKLLRPVSSLHQNHCRSAARNSTTTAPVVAAWTMPTSTFST